MSSEKENSTGSFAEVQANKRVLDEEGNVDEKIKTIVLQSRERIDRLEEGVFIEAATDPQIQIPYPQQVSMWGMAVKQYIRNIEPLLKSPEIAQSQRYYEEIDLGTIEFIPPDTEYRDYSLVAHDGYSDIELKQILNLPRAADLPEVRTESIQGLSSIIELPAQMTQRWRVLISDPGSPRDRKYDPLEVTKPIPKHTYEKAVREANEFLHNAGVGMDVGMPEVDDESEPW